MKYSTAILILVCTGLLLTMQAAPADAEVRPGVRFGGYFDASGAFIGGEVLADMAWENWYFNPNVEYVFADRADLVTFNFDFHYDLPVRSSFYFWIGGGPAIVYRNPDNERLDSETDFGLNILMGIGFNRGGRITPYIQPKVILSDHSDFALAFGVRF